MSRLPRTIIFGDQKTEFMPNIAPNDTNTAPDPTFETHTLKLEIQILRLVPCTPCDSQQRYALDRWWNYSIHVAMMFQTFWPVSSYRGPSKFPTFMLYFDKMCIFEVPLIFAEILSLKNHRYMNKIVHSSIQDISSLQIIWNARGKRRNWFFIHLSKIYHCFSLRIGGTILRLETHILSCEWSNTTSE